jgi:hypothetical protein
MLPLLVASLLAWPDSLRSSAELQLVALHHAKDVRTCYEVHGLAVNAQLRGMLAVYVTIAPTGRVIEAGQEPAYTVLDGVGGGAVAQCVVATMRNWHYDRGPYALDTVVYMFDLKPDIPAIRART